MNTLSKNFGFEPHLQNIEFFQQNS